MIAKFGEQSMESVMLRGTTIDARPPHTVARLAAAAETATSPPEFVDHRLDTAAANAFLGRKKGFLEKRRSSGIDSPRYLQRVKGGAVLYRASDLLAWEEERMLTCSSDHGHPNGKAR